MAKNMPKGDFRFTRELLPDEVFLWVDGKRPAPTDPVSKKVWNHIVHLPDDAALRTSDHHGTDLRALCKLWSAWINATGDDAAEPLFSAMLDATDCFQSSTFDALHGYYRSALSNLRSALELVSVGTLGNLAPNNDAYLRWRDNGASLALPECFKRLRRVASEPTKGMLFKPGGSIEALYYELCAYAHSRPDASDGAMWQSNGPVYVYEAFIQVFRSQLATYRACFLLAKVGRPKWTVSRKLERLIFTRPLATTDDEQTYRTIFFS
jgi:hypothetical protein